VITSKRAASPVISRFTPFDESIEERVVAAALAHPHRLSLDTGMAGVLVASARLMQLQPGDMRATRVTRLAGALAESLSERPMQAGLWGGVVGALYAMEYVWSVDPMLLGEHRQAIREFVDEMDEVLLGSLRARPREFDLISGPCGIGAYALVRTDIAAARRLYAAAEQALERGSELDDGLRSWRVPVDTQKPGPFDLGVAHGTPGVIGLLAHALRLGVATGRTGRMLDETLGWLHAQERRDLPHSRFASFTGPSGQSSRLAWCYGDLGVAAMAATAATVRQDPALEAWWRELAAQRLAQPPSTWMLADDPLCHGRAGVLHILRRLLARGWDLPEARALADDLERELADAPDDPGAPYGLLNGRAGVMLALAESVQGAPAGDRPWHLCMLTPA
jgi:hypothetical protein